MVMLRHLNNSILPNVGNVVALSGDVETLDGYYSLTTSVTFDVATLSCTVVTLT